MAGGPIPCSGSGHHRGCAVGSLLRDWRNQLSWGRVCAMVALLVAVVGQAHGMDVEHLKLWLLVATGGYGASKATEMVALLKNVGVAAPSAPGAVGSVEPSIRADRGNPFVEQP